jgi:hypothetical protein
MLGQLARGPPPATCASGIFLVDQASARGANKKEGKAERMETGKSLSRCYLVVQRRKEIALKIGPVLQGKRHFRKILGGNGGVHVRCGQIPCFWENCLMEAKPGSRAICWCRVRVHANFFLSRDISSYATERTLYNNVGTRGVQGPRSSSKSQRRPKLSWWWRLASEPPTWYPLRVRYVVGYKQQGAGQDPR